MTATIAPQRPTDPAPRPGTGGPRSRAERVALAVLLAGTAALYLSDLGSSGWANSYYAAAVQAMTQSWKAFFFGSLDAGNLLTVDKPPASLWVMALSGRVFGFSSWSMLVPQALMGVGTVALLYAAVRRVSGPGAGLVAGLVMALTPVAVLMFRFNNPDALLVLLMVAAAYATVRAIEKAGTRWLLLAGALIGFAFLAKMAQAFVVLPALALAYGVAAPTGLGRRIAQLLGAGVAVVVAAGWWLAAVALWPAEDRPYIGGSGTNSALELALGYNGLGRLLGRSATGGGGAPGGGEAAGGGGVPGGGGGFGGDAGLTRMFNAEIGGQVSWLLPAALALLVIGLLLVRRTPRTGPVRASLLLWGTWTVVTALVFSLMSGVFHAYYTVALAPGIAALVGIGGRELWRHRSSWPGRVTLAVLVAGTAAWAWVLLGRSTANPAWLRWAVVAAAVVAAVALLVRAGGRRWAAVAAVAVALTGLLGPAAYAAQTATTAHTGSIPLAGPNVDGAAAGGRFPGGAMPGGAVPGGAVPGGAMPGGAVPGGAVPGGALPSGALPGGALPGGALPGGAMPSAGRVDRTRGDPGTALGGPGAERTADPQLVAMLRAAGTRWAAATAGAQGAAGLELASGTSVMGIGGFTGSDPAPTLAQFQAAVAAGDVRYFVGGGSGGGPAGRGGSAEEIAAWVAERFAPTTVGGSTVYDLATG